MSKLIKRIMLLSSVAIIMTTISLQAVAAPSTVTITVPVIDTNIPLYILIGVPKIDTTSLGAAIIVR